MALQGPSAPTATAFCVSPQFPDDQTPTVQPGAAGQNRDALVDDNRQLQDPEHPTAGQDSKEQSWQTTAAGDPVLKALTLTRLQQSASAFGAPSQCAPAAVLFSKPAGNVGHASAPIRSAGALAGTKLGVNGSGEDVKVKREVGSPQGYGERWQAMAAARMAGAEPAAVVLGADKKFHALQLTAAMDSKFAAADPKRFVQAVPSSADIADAQKRVKDLKARLNQLNSEEPTDAVNTEKDAVRAELAKADLHRASVVLGVPESDIRFQSTFSGQQPGVINIVPDSPGDTPGSHGPAPGQGGENGFKPGMSDAFRIAYSALDDPASAQETLFHEVEHRAHWALAQHWAQSYERETGRMFVAGPGMKYFAQWMQDQAAKQPPRLSKADAELVVDIAGNRSGKTEAAANMRSVELALQAGKPELAAKALMAYARALTPRSQGGKGAYATPALQSQFMQGLIREIRNTYQNLPPDMQRKFEDAVAAAKQKYPGAWVSDLKLN
jgi:hypothetical protein